METKTLEQLIVGATPFLIIGGMRPVTWCRNVQRGPRSGPWQYKAEYSVVNDTAWNRLGEVLYFVTDKLGQLRMVGQSSRRLKDRWRLSPMHDVHTKLPMGERALFHTTAWPQIERAVHKEKMPLTVRALFGEDLAALCQRIGNPLSQLIEKCAEGPEHLSGRVEKFILETHGRSLGLWNKAGT